MDTEVNKQVDIILNNIVEIAKGNFDVVYAPENNSDTNGIDAIGVGISLLADHLKETTASKEELNKRLEEREVLLKEIHHRVKNNLQIITSLLALQSQFIKDEKVLELFRQSQNRILAMAAVHEMLYQSEDISKINFNKYIQKIVSNLTGTVHSTQVKTTYNIDKSIALELDQAIPLGLLINEVITNSLKHANHENLRISIELSKNGAYKLILFDNGNGFDISSINKDKTLGILLIEKLAKQLKGDIECESSSTGTTYRLEFPH